jgi:hypothetical protein
MQQERATLLAGLGLGFGAGLMYFLDPERGRRRRALARDRVVRVAHVGSDAMGATGRDVAQRVSGTTARLRGALRHVADDDAVVVERVRATLGRAVSHPRAIDVQVADGVVTLRGPIIQDEVSRLLRAVERVRGVREVVAELEEHEQAGNVPALQGGRSVSQREWSPATRLFTGTTGIALAGYGASRRDAAGALLAAAGAGLLARATGSLEMRRFWEADADRSGIPSRVTK